jgi:GntR family transcriptional regulator
MMDHEWNDSQPIYRQLRDRVVAMILDGAVSATIQRLGLT